jgi:hypothetical protein
MFSKPCWCERRDSKAKLSEKKNWQYDCRLFGRNGLMEGAVWPVDLLLGYHHTMKLATVQQSLLSNSSSNKHISMAMREYSKNGRGVFCAVHAEMV